MEGKVKQWVSILDLVGVAGGGEVRGEERWRRVETRGARIGGDVDESIINHREWEACFLKQRTSLLPWNRRSHLKDTGERNSVLTIVRMGGAHLGNWRVEHRE